MSTDKKKELRDFLDSMVDDNQEQAQVHFHNYLEDKMRNIINPPVEDVEAEIPDNDDE